MKKYLLGLAAVVVALSLSAFTGDGKQMKQAKDPGELHWFALPISNNIFLESTSSVNARDAESECTQTVTFECERAYTDDELIDPDDPEQGVDPSKYGTIAGRLYLQ